MEQSNSSGSTRELGTDSKDERVQYYLETASLPEHLLWNTGNLMSELGITDADLSAYRQKKEKEILVSPVGKRDIVVKQVIKPLLKEFGFSVSGQDWRRTVGDAYVIIHMMNSQFNSTVSGASFRFHISAAKKDEIREKPANQWIYNQFQDLGQFGFLAYCGRKKGSGISKKR